MRMKKAMMPETAAMIKVQKNVGEKIISEAVTLEVAVALKVETSVTMGISVGGKIMTEAITDATASSRVSIARMRGSRAEKL